MSNTAWPNEFRRRLLAGETLIGSWCALASPLSTEVLGLAGFDWLVLDGEHAPNDITTFVPQLMALKGSPSAPVVRPPCNEPVIIKRLLDIGFNNIQTCGGLNALSACRDSRRVGFSSQQHVRHGAGL